MSTSGPGISSLVVGYWPDLSDTDADEEYRLTTAIAKVATNRNLLTGQVRSPHARGVKPRLWITCNPRLHKDPEGGAPMLAQVWDTEHGALYVASIGGAAGERPRATSDPFEPPAFLFKEATRASRVTPAEPGRGAELVPVMVVRTFLPPREGVTLWVKCAEHGPGLVDPIKLAREYRADQKDRLEHDSSAMRVVRLHDAGALYSQQ
jgi:hypothetical protein